MRLTEKGIDNNYVVDTYISLNEPWKSPINKLGQLEDIEDEIGIDLITFFKIFGGQDVYIKLNNGEIIEGFSPIIEENLCGIYFTVDGKYANTIADYGSYYVSLKDYGKTWALTREELL